MSASDLTPERRNELEQWASLGHSPTQLSRMYGVSIDTVFRIRRMQRAGIAPSRPGRHPAVPAETVEAIVGELRKDGRRGRRVEMARRFGIHKSVVSMIASRAGLPKFSCGRKTRHNKKTMDRLAEYFGR